jgi:hypothetical protein
VTYAGRRSGAIKALEFEEEWLRADDIRAYMRAKGFVSIEVKAFTPIANDMAR